MSDLTMTKKFQLDNPSIRYKYDISYNLWGEPIFFIELSKLIVKKRYCGNEINTALLEGYEWVTNREVTYNQVISGWPFPIHLLQAIPEGNNCNKSITWNFMMTKELKDVILNCKLQHIRDMLINLFFEYLDLARTVNMIWVDSPYDNSKMSGFPVGMYVFPINEIDYSTIDQFINRCIGAQYK